MSNVAIVGIGATPYYKRGGSLPRTITELAGEAILAATLLVFLFAYLNLNRWHVRYAHITIAWLAFLAALVALALYEPPVASGIARVSLVAVAVLVACLLGAAAPAPPTCPCATAVPSISIKSRLTTRMVTHDGIK